jgi:tetratricopeptide (TPR) repeat protein
MTEESSRSGAEVDAFAILANGTGALDNQEARRAFGLDPNCDDELFAQAVVRHAARAALPLPAASSSRPPHTASELPSLKSNSSAPPARVADPVLSPRTSYILRMPAATTSPGLSVSSLDDVRTLMLIIRAGGLFQRRAAVLRIGELLLGDAVIPSDWRKQAIDMLTHQRHFDLAYEAGEVLAKLPGGDGRAARANQRSRQELTSRVQARVLAFWEGEESDEPIGALSAEDRAQLLTRTRELTDVPIRHLGALLEDAGLIDDTQLRVLVTSLEHSGDSRLFPALRSLLYAQNAAVNAACVRALSRIEDSRVPALLRDAYERATRGHERLLLAAALGRHGDARGLSYARSVLAERDAVLLPVTLEALSELGGSDDVQPIVELLEHDQPLVVRGAVLALGRSADGRALVPLSELRGRVQRSALRADIEEAEASIVARAELLGEPMPSTQSTGLAWDTRRMVAQVRNRDPALLRARARLYHGFAYVCLLCGAQQRAAALFEAAAALRPGWLPPVLALAFLHVRARDVAAALSAFRRALDSDRAELEADPRAITALAKTYLRRAEAMERSGRFDIARGLIEEALSYDLRRANAEVRLGLGERREAHRARER